MRIPDEAINWTVGTVLTAISAWIIKICKTQQALREGTKAILRDRLLQACKEHLGHDHISADDMDNLNSMYKAYKGLGGNGTVKKLYMEVYSLPTFDKENT